MWCPTRQAHLLRAHTRVPACRLAAWQPSFTFCMHLCSSSRVADTPGHPPSACSRSAGSSSAGIGALHLAAWHGDAGRVQQLLAQGASVHATDGDGWTASHYAVRGPSLRCLAQLLAAGADPSAPAGRLRQTPLHFAASAGEPDLVAALLAAGSCADRADAAGRTALTLATQNLVVAQAAERTAPYQQPAEALRKASATLSLLQAAAMQAAVGRLAYEAEGGLVWGGCAGGVGWGGVGGLLWGGTTSGCEGKAV